MIDMRRLLLLPVLSLSLAACVSMPPPSYQPGISNTELLLQKRSDKLAVDGFDAAPGINNRSLGIRGSQLTGGSDGTFGTYLQEALVTELKAAGKYEGNSPLRISGTLLRNDLDGGAVKRGTARVAARFVVKKGEAVVYDKSFEAQHEWESSFIGALAIPAAMDNYAGAVQKLVGMLFADADFSRSTTAGLQ
ncbi:hypothetical protein [Lysobacter solisilvae (ex Woo and Kim 2020)]|uniref:DUF4410 domain-containing protein n=1 Tax=Agrilutibacter terrestris TaxID=2865112 RepID=A0A7H0FWS2_9GAMM|nr:hypothetical protein [Lysobacter terrestris]QNP40488.1 hypothetical protein H8B22_13610 [Lysobacter terrestris]